MNEEVDISPKSFFLMIWFSCAFLLYMVATVWPDALFWTVVLFACLPLVKEVYLRYQIYHLKKEVEKI